MQRGARETGLPAGYICFGYCIYCDAHAFAQVHREMGEVCDYQGMRQTVADMYFNGNADFCVADAMAAGVKLGPDVGYESGGSIEMGDFGGGDGGGGGGD